MPEMNKELDEFRDPEDKFFSFYDLQNKVIGKFCGPGLQIYFTSCMWWAISLRTTSSDACFPAANRAASSSDVCFSAATRVISSCFALAASAVLASASA